MKFEKNEFIQNYKNLEILKKEYLDYIEKNWNPEIDSEEKENELISNSIDYLIEKFKISDEYDFYLLDNKYLIIENSEFIIKIKI